MSQPSLRSVLIRLAASNAEMRSHLLPLLREGSHPLDRVRKHQLMPSSVVRKIPDLYSQEDVKDPMVWVKLFSPYTNAVWLITEYSPADRTAFGWADLGFGELGYIDIGELEGLNKRGLPLVERDLSWTPKVLSKAKRD